MVLFETECTLTLHDRCFYARDVVKVSHKFLPQLENRLVLKSKLLNLQARSTTGFFPQADSYKNKKRRSEIVLRRKSLKKYGLVVINVIPFNEGQDLDCGIYVPSYRENK